MADEETCIHCQSYWRAGHTEDCPQMTGIYPVTSSEDGMICGHCHGGLGQYYTTVDSVIVCVGCAADITLLDSEPSWGRTS